MTGEVNILTINRGAVVAPAGCGKTQLIADALKRHQGPKPILILTHTNAGVVALKNRLDRAKVNQKNYRLLTIDGWAIKLISTFPIRSGYRPEAVRHERPNYTQIRQSAAALIGGNHINDVIAASYERVLVDEYQDCSSLQHAIVLHVSQNLPTCVMGDPMQAIFGFGDDRLAHWQGDVLAHFTPAGELTTPWRWINAEAEPLGQWLLDVRQRLESCERVDLRAAPDSVEWVSLDGTDNQGRLLQAGRVAAPSAEGSVLIIGESTNPGSQRQFASQTPGAVTVEAVDLRDLITFAQTFDLQSDNALERVAFFAQALMTNVGANDLMNRVGILRRGTARKPPTRVEAAAISFLEDRTYKRMDELFTEINAEGGVRAYRPAVLHALHRALHRCHVSNDVSFAEAALIIREQNRLLGRPLPRRAVGSTLLLKGLEAEVAVILNADQLDAKNLYVAMTRGSKKLVICSQSPVLPL